MARDAIEGYLDVLQQHGRPIPAPAAIERITIST